MTFQEDSIEAFLFFLSGKTPEIRNFPGCRFLQILREQENPNVLLTLSHWESADALEHYRRSELFRSVWAKTKIHFSAKPEAWSLDSIEIRS